MASRKKAVRVSPFIKASRYSFLFAGIFYGYNKKMFLEGYERREKIKRDIKIAERHARYQRKAKEEFKDVSSTTKSIATFSLWPVVAPKMPTGFVVGETFDKPRKTVTRLETNSIDIKLCKNGRENFTTQ